MYQPDNTTNRDIPRIENAATPWWRAVVKSIVRQMGRYPRMDQPTSHAQDQIVVENSINPQNGYKPDELSAAKVIFPNVLTHSDVWDAIVTHYKQYFSNNDSLAKQHNLARTVYDTSQSEIYLLAQAFNSGKFDDKVLHLLGATTTIDTATLQTLLQIARDELVLQDGILRGSSSTAISVAIAEKAIHDPSSLSFEQTTDGTIAIGLYPSPDTNKLQGILHSEGQDSVRIMDSITTYSRSTFLSSLDEYNEQLRKAISNVISMRDASNTSISGFELVRQAHDAINSAIRANGSTDSITPEIVEAALKNALASTTSGPIDPDILREVAIRCEEFKKIEKEYNLALQYVRLLPAEYLDFVSIVESDHQSENLGSKLAELHAAIIGQSVKSVYSGEYITIEGQTDTLPPLLKEYSKYSSNMVQIRSYQKKTYFTMRAPFVPSSNSGMKTAQYN